MAITLVNSGKLETQPLRKGVIMNLLRYSPLLGNWPFESVDSLTSIAVRAKTLPTVAFRRINSGYTPSEGDFEQVWESVYGFGGEIEFDRVFDKVTNMIVKPRVAQAQLKLKAMALSFSDYVVNGDHAVDVDGFEGLKKRIAAMPARQTVYAAGAAGDSTAALDPTGSTANARAFLDKWEQAMYRCNSGNVSKILLNEGTYWGFGRILRFLGVSGGPLFDITRDEFDREILSYKGAAFYDVGLKRDQVTEIITGTEVANDAGADATSVYFVSHDMEQGVTGIQLSPMEVYDPLDGGERESKPTKLMRIDWWVGLAGFGSYGCTRLRNFEDVAGWT